MVTNKNQPISGIETTIDLLGKLREMNSVLSCHYSKKRTIKAINKVFSKSKSHEAEQPEMLEILANSCF